MTGPELEAARKRLKLTAAELARRLYLEAKRDPGQTVRNWETGRTPIPGPVRAAVQYMLGEHAMVQRSLRYLPAPQEGAPQAVSPAAGAPDPAPVLKTRRRS